MGATTILYLQPLYSQATLEVLGDQLLQEDPAHHVVLADPGGKKGGKKQTPVCL